MTPSADRKLGIGLTLGSAVVFSLAGLYTKSVEASAWDIIFWRGLFSIAFTIAYVAWRGSLRREFPEMGVSGVWIGVVGAAATAAFIFALKLTSIANVSLIYAACPLIAAVIAWAWFSEMITRPLLLGCVFSIAGVTTIVSGSFNSLNLNGDLLALAMTFGMAIMFVIYRRYPTTPAAGPTALSSLLLLHFGIVLGAPFDVALFEIGLIAVFGLSFSIAAITLNDGAKRLRAGEVALLNSMEIVFAPLFAWLVLSELPPVLTFIGGFLIVIGVAVSQFFVNTKEA